MILALVMFAAPALGVPSLDVVQDTFKSLLLSFSVLAAAVWFFWRHRHQKGSRVRWHVVVLLPLALAAHALSSMFWSYPSMAGVEAVRWLIFSVLVWLGINTLSREGLPWLALGVHAGAVVASLWAAFQFWFNFGLFPQGMPPASSFANRNFFAEFAVVALPFSAFLLAREQTRWRIALLAATSGLVILAVMMTGTRSAIIAMLVQLGVAFPLLAWACRKQLAFGQWDWSRRLLVLVVLLATVVGLSTIQSGNPKIVEEGRGLTAVERAFTRTRSISASDGSLGVRIVMWKATARMIGDRFPTGAGAGAWSSDIPLYQVAGSQLEDDFYAHNEFLQLGAEYGMVGVIFVLGLMTYLLRAAWLTLNRVPEPARAELPLRAVALCSLLALMIVSNAGFAWHLGSTAALFALCLGLLGASDVRQGLAGRLSGGSLPALGSGTSGWCAAGLATFAALAVWPAWQLVQSERHIFKAVVPALAITRSGDYTNPKYAPAKDEILKHIKAGTDINPAFRRAIPMVGDELARWGDWKNATWVWESVLSSHPYVVTLLTNVARGYSRTQQPERAMAYLERARKVQPNATTVKALDIILLTQLGQDDKALALTRDALGKQLLDYDMLNAAYTVAERNRDYATALRAMELRLATWPQEKPLEAYVRLGNMHHAAAGDKAKALDYFQRAANLTPPFEREALSRQMPREYASRIL